jgi:hypothetical protein
MDRLRVDSTQWRARGALPTPASLGSGAVAHAIRRCAMSAIDVGIGCQVLIATYFAAACAYLDAAIAGSPAGPAIAATFLISWQVYTADRFAVHPEDLTRDDEDLDRVRFLRRHRGVCRILVVASLVAEGVLLIGRPQLVWGFGIGLGLGILYVVEIPLLRRRIKCVPYAKTVYVPLVAVATMLLLLERFPRDRFEAVAAGGMYLLIALNTVVFDIKDRESDRRARIRTLANALDVRAAIAVVQTACLLVGATVAVLDPRAPGVALTLAFCTFAALVGGVTAPRQWSSRFYFGLLDASLALPALFLAVIRLVG